MSNTAIWSGPGMLAALSYSGEGTASVTTSGDGPPSAFGGSADASNTVYLEFSVGQEGLEVAGTVNEFMSILVQSNLVNHLWTQNQDPSKTVQLGPGQYRVFVRTTAAGAGAQSPPSSQSETKSLVSWARYTSPMPPSPSFDRIL
jgi:hypothetical protein